MAWVPFLFAAVVLAITPGPGIAYVVARTVAGGRKEGLASCLGNAVGGFAHVAAAALGLSLIIANSAIAFTILKYIGALYLMLLGLRMLLHEQPTEAQWATPTSVGARRALAQGVMVEALNVKTALFFLAFLPQFVSGSGSVALQMSLMGSVCVALNTLVDVAAVLAASRLLRASAARRARAQVMTRVSGMTMLGLGAYLALARRPS